MFWKERCAFGRPALLYSHLRQEVQSCDLALSGAGDKKENETPIWILLSAVIPRELRRPLHSLRPNIYIPMYCLLGHHPVSDIYVYVLQDTCACLVPLSISMLATWARRRAGVLMYPLLTMLPSDDVRRRRISCGCAQHPFSLLPDSPLHQSASRAVCPAVALFHRSPYSSGQSNTNYSQNL
jgi:hypothetical protein